MVQGDIGHKYQGEMLVINIKDIFFNVEGFLLVFQTFERSLIFTTSGIVIATTLNVKSVKVIEDAFC